MVCRCFRSNARRSRPGPVVLVPGRTSGFGQNFDEHYEYFNECRAADLSPVQVRGQAVRLYMLAMRGGGASGSLATEFSVTLFGIREALLINGLLAILVQVLIGQHWRRTPIPESIDLGHPFARRDLPPDS